MYYVKSKRDFNIINHMTNQKSHHTLLRIPLNLLKPVFFLFIFLHETHFASIQIHQLQSANTKNTHRITMEKDKITIVILGDGGTYLVNY